MSKKIFILLLIILFSLSFFVSSFAQNEEKDIPEKVLIDAIAEIKPEGVTLEHKKHVKEYNLSCRECHHMYDKKDKKPKPCIECHDLVETKVIQGIRTRLIKTSIMKNIYHDNCKSCHDKLERKGKPFPKKCSTCHLYEIN